MNYIIKETDSQKILASKSYNYIFRKSDGYFCRWGINKDHDPDFSPFGPEILDLEISINGCPNNCEFCYKGNSDTEPTNMSFESFKQILETFRLTDEIVEIELEDGKIINLEASTPIILVGGGEKLAEELVDGDDILYAEVNGVMRGTHELGQFIEKEIDV